LTAASGAVARKQPDGTYRIHCRVCSQLLVENARSPERYASLIVKHETQECPANSSLWVFDNPETRRFTEDRMEFLTPFLREWRKTVELKSALDVGCGLGDFSGFLWELGIATVRGVDGRAENIAEAHRRHPSCVFEVADAEELPMEQLGISDLVLCFGLLYHLENPFRAIRRLHAVTGKILLIESIVVPGEQPKMEILDETSHTNQGLNSVALYPSEPGLVKALYRSGFPFVYGFVQMPANPLYRKTLLRKRMRTMLLASKIELQLPGLHLRPDVPRWASPEADPWRTFASRFFHR
jgi:SAM-dependent methyltransferase